MTDEPRPGILDLMALGGLALIVVGLAMISIPVALVVTGAIMFGSAVTLAVLSRRGRVERGER